MTVGLSCGKFSFSETGALSPILGTGATSFCGGDLKLLSSWVTAELSSAAAVAITDVIYLGIALSM